MKILFLSKWSHESDDVLHMPSQLWYSTLLAIEPRMNVVYILST